VRRLLLATCSAFADGDEDDRLLLDPLAASNVDADFVVWDDPDVDWTAGPVVLRSTWDYTLHRTQFLAWTRTLAALHNCADVVEWNSDKVYLQHLADAGVPITPTKVVRPGTRLEVPDHEFVVKPSVGAGSRGAGRFLPSAAEQASAHAARLHDAGRTVLVQPYLGDVDEYGETALIYFAGEFSHAVRKGPMLTGDTGHDLGAGTGLFLDENITARDASTAEVAVGDQAVRFLRDRFGSAPLYARVDVLPGPDGPVVIELELIEPSLFLGYAAGAVDRFAALLATVT
jgi:hypothetical protein